MDRLNKVLKKNRAKKRIEKEADDTYTNMREAKDEDKNPILMEKKSKNRKDRR